MGQERTEASRYVLRMLKDIGILPLEPAVKPAYRHRVDPVSVNEPLSIKRVQELSLGCKNSVLAKECRTP